MGWWVSVPRFGVSWFFRLHVEASAHGSSGPPVLPVGSLVLWSSWLIGCGHRIIRSIAEKLCLPKTLPKEIEKQLQSDPVHVHHAASHVLHCFHAFSPSLLHLCPRVRKPSRLPPCPCPRAPLPFSVSVSVGKMNTRKSHVY